MKKSHIFFIIPSILFVGIFLIYPSLRSVLMTFFDQSGNFVGLNNYIDVLSSDAIINLSGFPKWPPLGALPQTIIWMSIHIPATIFLGIGLALLIRKIRFGNLLKSIIFISLVIPMVVGGVIIQFLFGHNAGIIPAFFELIGINTLNITWTAHPETSLISLIIGSIWIWTPFGMIVYDAGLSNLPKEYIEMTRIDGASSFERFWHVTFPLLKNSTMVIFIMTLLWDLKNFGLVYAATRGGPANSSTVLAVEVYEKAFIDLNFNLASTIAVILTLIAMGAIYLQIMQVEKK